MVKISDIRISNWFTDRDGTGNPFQVMYVSKNNDSSNLKGIPITEAILLKSGFKDEGEFTNKVCMVGSPSGDLDGSRRFTLGHSEIYLYENEWRYKIDEHDDDYGLHLTTKTLKYIHQLQNLHYALEDKELDIKF